MSENPNPRYYRAKRFVVDFQTTSFIGVSIIQDDVAPGNYAVDIVSNGVSVRNICTSDALKALWGAYEIWLTEK